MTEKPTLTLRRRIAAVPRLVYAAWTDPAMIVMWWGPAGAKTLSAEADPRPGGRYHVVFTTPDGESHDVSGTYRDANPHSLLSFTWMWRTLPDRTSFVTLTFEGEGCSRRQPWLRASADRCVVSVPGKWSREMARQHVGLATRSSTVDQAGNKQCPTRPYSADF